MFFVQFSIQRRPGIITFQHSPYYESNGSNFLVKHQNIPNCTLLPVLTFYHQAPKPSSSAECVKVVVRCRPLNEKEIKDGRQRYVLR